MAWLRRQVRLGDFDVTLTDVTGGFACFALWEPNARAVAEPVRLGDEVVGRVTSGGFGYTCEKSLAYAYLPVELAEPGTGVEVNLFGAQVPATVTDVRALLAR